MEGPRGVKDEKELESAVRLADAVFYSGKKPRSMRDDFPLLFSKSNTENLRVFVDNGKVISLVGAVFGDIVLFGHRIPAVRLGAVCTDPEYRGRGLATSLLADTERFAVRKGAVVAVISGARGLYERFGAVDAGRFWKYTLETKMLRRFDAVDIRPAVYGDLPRLARAYAEKAVRFERRYDDFNSLFTASMALDRPAQIFIHEGDSSDICSYIVVVRDTKGILNCVEYAGDPLRVVGMLRSLSEGEGETVVVHTIAADRTMNHLLSLVSQPEINKVPRTWKILSREGLFASLNNYFAERLPQSEVAAIQELMGKIDGPELTRVVFGTAKLPIVTEAGSPFPIPLPAYGMDYL